MGRNVWTFMNEMKKPSSQGASHNSGVLEPVPLCVVQTPTLFNHAPEESMMSATLRLVSPSSANSWTEAEIKQLSKENSRMALEMVIYKYRDRLFYHAAGIVKDWQEAYDVVQEVFIRAMREPRFFTADFKMKAWLFRVTTNLCFNLVRDRRRRGQILETRCVHPIGFERINSKGFENAVRGHGGH